MSNVAFARLMSRYNRWQNENLLNATAGLTVDARRLDRGAFFGSIEATFAHLLWGDTVWMSRFAPERIERPTQRPERGSTVEWDAFLAARQRLDEAIVIWADALDDAAFDEPLTWYSGLTGKQMTRDRALVVTHFFNHQTHHRGQIHAMLTAAGASPSDTDLILMPLG